MLVILYLHKICFVKGKVAEPSLGYDLGDESAFVALFPKQTGGIEDARLEIGAVVGIVIVEVLLVHKN